MIRKAFVMKLYEGNEDEYQRRHNPIWPELEAVIKAHGVHNYSIFRRGLELFAYAEIEDEARWASLADEPVVRRWWEHMAPLMESNPDASPMAVDIVEVFHLD